MSKSQFRKVSAFKTVDNFRARLAELGLDILVDDAPLSATQESPLAQPLVIRQRAAADENGSVTLTVGNRWCVHPMEGWDGTAGGSPTERTLVRWRHFGESGAKLIWGGEAYAVNSTGRANPRQLCWHDTVRDPRPDLRRLVDTGRSAHIERFGSTSAESLVLGLQLTHSGRFSVPEVHGVRRPRIGYHHPILDQIVRVSPNDESVVLTDGELRQIVDRFVAAAAAAYDAGFQFVDIKQCHGYLGHEMLSAFDRPGQYGGDLHGRSRFYREIAAGVRATSPQLLIGSRLSMFDGPPFIKQADGTPGVCWQPLPDRYPAFGVSPVDPQQISLDEPIELLRHLVWAGLIDTVNLTAGIPYTNPHLQRPAAYPPSDGYIPPEDPLVGCGRQIAAAAAIKRAVPSLPVVGSAYSYFQEFVPHVAQGIVRRGDADAVGLGRMVLSYWDLPRDVQEGRPWNRKRVCRTFSECTTAPRQGQISGCYPLDPAYKQSESPSD